MIEAFHGNLRRFSDEQVMAAGHRYLDDGKRFPVPSDIRERIVGSVAEDQKADKFELRPSRTCSTCGAVRFCIRDPESAWQWRCRECYTGLTPEEHRAKMEGILAGVGRR